MLFKKHLIETEKLTRYGMLLLAAGLMIFIAIPFLPNSISNVSHFIMGLLLGCGITIAISGAIRKRRR